MISDEEGTSTASETEKVKMENQQEKGKEESIKENIKKILQFYK